jgi:hypothetical protein
MSDFTRARDIEHPVKIPIRIGDIYIDRKHLKDPHPMGRAVIVDRYPFDETCEATRVALERLDTGVRERRLDVAELNRRYAFRKAAV